MYQASSYKLVEVCIFRSIIVQGEKWNSYRPLGFAVLSFIWLPKIPFEGLPNVVETLTKVHSQPTRLFLRLKTFIFLYSSSMNFHKDMWACHYCMFGDVSLSPSWTATMFQERIIIETVWCNFVSAWSACNPSLFGKLLVEVSLVPLDILSSLCVFRS